MTFFILLYLALIWGCYRYQSEDVVISFYLFVILGMGMLIWTFSLQIKTVYFKYTSAKMYLLEL